MKPVCVELQERLAGEGTQALAADATAQRHLEECTECRQGLEQLGRLDAALEAMPAPDAPECVVAELLARVGGEAARTGLAEPRKKIARRPVLWGLATAAAVLLAVAIPIRNRPGVPRLPATGAPEVDQTGSQPQLTAEQAKKLRALGSVRGAHPDLSMSEPRSKTDAGKDGEPANELAEGLELQDPLAAKDKEEAGAKQRPTLDFDDTAVAGGRASGPREPLQVGGTIKAPPLLRRVDPVYPETARRARVEGVVVLEIVIDVHGKVQSTRLLRSVPLLDGATLEAVKQWVYAPTILNGRAVPVTMIVTVTFRLPEATPEKQGSWEPGSPDLAQAFLDERARTEGVSFQPATGYWANTYLPGDPALRLLRARLSAGDRSPLPARAGSPLRLHDIAARPSQPFDPPRQAGLAVYLSADRRGLDQPSRMLLQVGLKGCSRSGGPRPPMSVGLVLDLRGDVPTETAADMRALALAFAQAHEAGDRFHLIVAGRPGGVVVGDDGFKYGPLTLVLDRLLMGTASPDGPAIDLPHAVAAALREASPGDDPDAGLGSGAVVLVTGQPLGDSAEVLNDLAHQGAVAGVPLSVVTVGSSAASAELDELALVGQGSRRRLEARAEAPRLVEAELAGARDVVARAVRLRIRLAPGVRLVEAVGSRRLDDMQAQRVREVERSLDLRLSRNLGIDSDRGQDEDGIQIVIPTFRAGDAHVILLDVVAAGAGTVAEVGVRYKDVVFLRNGVARASLTLPAGERAPGPLERNVLKNLLALRLAQSLSAAGDALGAGDPVQAAALLERAHGLRSGLGGRVPGLAGDRELIRDTEMLQEYAQLLAGGLAAGPQRAYITDSLQYAGRLKRLPRPAPGATGAL